METSRKWTCIKRIIAYLMTIAMVLSTVDNTALYAYATEADANIETFSETGTENGEENNYAGKEFTEDWGDRELSGFEINAWEMDENADFEAEALAILSGLEKTYDTVILCYRSLADAVSKDLWNAAVAVTDAGNKDYEQIRVNFGSGSTAPDENWCFNNVMETEEAYTQDINLAIDYTVSTENGGGVTVQLDGEAIGLSAFADNVNLCLSTDSMNREDSYLAFQTAFGTENKKLEVQGEDGYAVSTGYYRVDTNEDNPSINVDIHEMHNIVPGASYQIVEAIYKGVIDDSDENFRHLYLAYYEAGVDSLDEETIIGILGEYAEAGEKFDAVDITNPETETLIIDKDIVNAAAALFPAADGAERPLSFNFRNGENGTNKAWVLINPTANQAEDQTVSSSLTISAENKVEVQASAPTFSAEKYQVIYSFDSNNENYGKLREIFPFEDFSWNLLHIGDGDALGAFLPNLGFVDLVIYVDTDTVWSAEKTYEVVAPPYSGTEFTEERDDGEFSGLEISVWDMDEDTDFEAEALRVLTALEKTYDIITLTYGYGSGQVSKDVWNAAVAAVDAGNKDNEQIRVSFENDSTYMFENWCFTDVAEITQEDMETVTLSVEYAFSEESNGGATFKINEGTTDFTLLAGNSNVSIGTDRNYLEEAYNAVQVAFGTEEKDLEVKDSTGNVMTGGRYFTHSDDENSYVDMNVDELQKLTEGEVYSVVEAVYKGEYNSWTEEDGYEFVNLYLHPGNVDKDSFTAEEITSLLSNYGEKSFDEITIVYCNDAMTGTVSNDVINATLAYLKDSTEERASSVRISFQNSTTRNTIEWILVNPQEQTEDQTLTATFELAEENAKVTVASQTVKADRINLNIIRSRENDSETVSTLEEMYGTGWVRLSVENTDCWTTIDSDDWNIWISIDDINQLIVDTAYPITKYVYRGHVENRDEMIQDALVISYQDAGVESLDEETLLEILAYYAEAGMTFDSIEIRNPETETMVIDKDVVNAAAVLFKTEGEVERPLAFNFRNDENGTVKSWVLINPTANQTEDQTISSALTISQDNKVEIQASECKFSAEKYQMIFSFDGDKEIYGKLREKFPFEDFSWNLLHIGDKNVLGAFLPHPENVDIVVYVDADTVWSAEKTYEVTVAPYTGRIDIWDDGTRELFINFWDNQGEAFTEEQLLDILEEYSTQDEINSIYINQPKSDNNTIYKSVADKACDLLENGGTVKFSFTDTNTSQFVEWHLQNVNPETEQIADQNVNASLIMGLEENCVYLSVAEQELVAENVMVLFGTSRMNEGEQADEFIMGIFGEETKELETENAETAGWYNVDEWNVIMEFYDPSALVGGEFYKVIPKAYRGYVDEFEENGEIIRSIYLSSFGIEADAFTEASFRATIQYYIDKDIKFDHIFIEQKYSSNNIIKKELINAAREIMKDTGMSSVDFGFCACIGEEYDENGDITQEFIQNDMIWELQNPGYAYEDIDANISLISKGNAGLSVVLKENYYDVENINLNFNISPETEIYKEVLVPTFGEATYEQSGPLVVLENVSDLRTDIGAFYNLNPENDLVSFYLCGMQDWAQETDNRLVKCDYTTLVIPVGQTVDINFANVPDVGVLEVNSLTPDIISVNKTERNVEITALLAGEQGYFLAAYPMDGKECIEVISVWTSLEETLEIPYIPYIAAVPGVEQTLADIDLNKLVFGDGEANGSFAWVDPTIELAPLANTDFHTFGAIYTNKKGKKANVNIVVNMIRAEEIFLFKGVTYDEEIIPEELNGTTMKVGEELVIGTDVWFNNDAIGSYLESGKVLLQWSSKETLTDATEYFGVMDVPKKYIATKKGKKVFTLSVVSKKTGKVLLSKSATVNVVGKDLFSFESPDFEFVDVVNENEPMKGTFVFIINPDNYEIAKKISVKSEDSSVLKLDKAVVIQKAGEPVIIEVGYTFKKYGKTAITVTTADEMKSKISYTCERVDYEPKLLNTSFTFDKTWKMDDIIFTELPIAYQRDTYLNDTIRITGESADKFEIIDNFLILNDINIKEKTYTLTLEIPVMIPDTETVQTYNQTIKVKVTKTNPKVTIKQTKKVNEFYKNTFFSTEGAGRITINAGEYKVLVPHIVEENSRFMIFPIEGTNDYYIMLGGNSESEGKAISKEEKTVTIEYILENDTGMLQRTTSFTIKTENKKPSLITSDKDTTLYPNVGYVDAKVEFINKKTNEMIMPYYSTIEVVLNKKTGETYTVRELENTDSFIKIGKNNYKIYSEGEDICIILDKTNFVKSTDKITFRIKQDDYGKPVDVTYTVKVDNKVPKIKLSNKTLTLNANADVYKCQTAETKVEVTGFKNLPVYDEIKFIGLEDKFNFDYNEGSSVLTVTFKDKVTPGNYKCKVETKILDQVISTDLTIKVVDKSVAKAVKVSKKGSIDVLRRETTMITMNPKFTNLSGEIIDFELKGPDADMFNAYYDAESGNCVVKVKSSYSWEGRQEYNFSTKYNYKVIPVYVLEDNGIYLVEGAQQKVKLTQSKPKLTVSSNSTILYADKGNNMIMDFKAVSKGEEIAIKEVRLLNYVNDLYWNSETGELGVYDEVSEMKKAKGKYTLKFEVIYTDKAGNEKTAQTSYKVTVVR